MPKAMTVDVKALYPESYFTDNAYGQDPKRAAAYRQEGKRLLAYAGLEDARLLDVGCGTGDFLDCLASAASERYGIEISDFAASKAAERGITMVRRIDELADLDLILFRGTIQHLDTPFLALQQAAGALKPGGVIAFLATPNANSPVYRRMGTLPALDPSRNFWVPSDRVLAQVLENLGFESIQFTHPYINGPYARPVSDHLKYLMSFFGYRGKFAFWRSMMECFARKGGNP